MYKRQVPDYAVIKLFRHIVQGEGPDTIVRGIDEAIQALPEGYDTVCTDGIFSQGEWQLLSIARAAAADPAVLLLDEITANLDAETEARVREALRQASRGRTVLSVSHRIYEMCIRDRCKASGIFSSSFCSVSLLYWSHTKKHTAEVLPFSAGKS